jgi:hypothetical protein
MSGALLCDGVRQPPVGLRHRHHETQVEEQFQGCGSQCSSSRLHSAPPERAAGVIGRAGVEGSVLQDALGQRMSGLRFNAHTTRTRSSPHLVCSGRDSSRDPVIRKCSMRST